MELSYYYSRKELRDTVCGSSVKQCPSCGGDRIGPEYLGNAGSLGNVADAYRLSCSDCGLKVFTTMCAPYDSDASDESAVAAGLVHFSVSEIADAVREDRMRLIDAAREAVIQGDNAGARACLDTLRQRVKRAAGLFVARKNH